MSQYFCFIARIAITVSHTIAPTAYAHSLIHTHTTCISFWVSMRCLPLAASPPFTGLRRFSLIGLGWWVWSAARCPPLTLTSSLETSPHAIGIGSACPDPRRKVRPVNAMVTQTRREKNKGYDKGSSADARADIVGKPAGRGDVLRNPKGPTR